VHYRNGRRSSINIQAYIDVEVPSGFDNVGCDKKNIKNIIANSHAARCVTFKIITASYNVR
jgi:hypothetical protein